MNFPLLNLEVLFLSVKRAARQADGLGEAGGHLAVGEVLGESLEHRYDPHHDGHSPHEVGDVEERGKDQERDTQGYEHPLFPADLRR